MGEFYGSTQIKAADREKVLAAAEKVAKGANIRCLVGPVLGDWIGVYPENNGQDEKIGAALAREFNCVVMHVLLHDGDVLAYWLWQGGVLVDRFWSAPGYFGEEDRAEQEEMRGDAVKIAELCGGDARKIDRLLREGRSTFESERLERLGNLLKIKNLAHAYEYLKEEGGGEGVTGFRRFKEVPGEAVEAEKEARRRERDAVVARKKALKAEGLMLGEVSLQHSPPAACVAVADGFVVMTAKAVRFGEPAKPTDVVRYRAPWKGEKLASELEGFVRWAASDAAGQTIVAVQNERCVLFDVGAGSILRNMTGERTRLGYGAAMGGVFVEREGGEWPIKLERGSTAIESAKWLLVRRQGGEIEIFERGAEGPRKAFYPGGRIAGRSPDQFAKQMAKLDIAEMEKRQREAMEQVIARFEGMGKKRGKFAALVGPEELERVREQMRKEWEERKTNLLAMKAGKYEEAGRAREDVYLTGISGNEQWFWTVSHEGLKVYEFGSVVGVEGQAQPAWTFSPGQLMAVAEASGNLLVGGFEGAVGSPAKIWWAELESGKRRELMALPEGSVAGLLVSRDGRYLGIRVSPMRERGRGTLQFWDLGKLVGRMGPKWSGG